MLDDVWPWHTTSRAMLAQCLPSLVSMAVNGSHNDYVILCLPRDDDHDI